MSITPKCNQGGEELVEFGSILLSPPDANDTVRKFHICKVCYEQMREELE